MKYQYEDLSPGQFEELVVLVSKKLFGAATQGFSSGPDGGRDAKFIGTAEIFPSSQSPWKGVTIIQAKHTNGYNRNFSEKDFYSPGSESAVLSKEVQKIKKLVENKQINNYFLVANRRLAANAEQSIRDYISVKTDLLQKNIHLAGIEALELWMKEYEHLPKYVNLCEFDKAFTINPNDLSNVVNALSEQFSSSFSNRISTPEERVAYEKKCEINGITTEFSDYLKERFLPFVNEISTFLGDPMNYSLVRLYDNAVDEFQPKLIQYVDQFETFDSAYNYILDLLLGRDPILNSNKRITRAMLFYMFWNCDLGRKG